MKKLLLIAVLLICDMTFGQRLLNEFGNEYYSPNLYFDKYNAPEGSPYLNDTFLPARINDITETQLVRFDAFEGRVEVKLSPTRVVVLDSDIPYIIALKDGSEKVFETLPYVDSKGQSKTSFFELIHQAEYYILYKKEGAKFYKEEKAQGYQEAKPARFKLTGPVYYIKVLKKSSEVLTEIPDRLKDFKQAYPNHEKAIKDLVKKENLQLDDPEDLIMIFNLYYTDI